MWSLVWNTSEPPVVDRPDFGDICKTTEHLADARWRKLKQGDVVGEEENLDDIFDLLDMDRGIPSTNAPEREEGSTKEWGRDETTLRRNQIQKYPTEVREGGARGVLPLAGRGSAQSTVATLATSNAALQSATPRAASLGSTSNISFKQQPSAAVAIQLFEPGSPTVDLELRTIRPQRPVSPTMMMATSVTPTPALRWLQSQPAEVTFIPFEPSSKSGSLGTITTPVPKSTITSDFDTAFEQKGESVPDWAVSEPTAPTFEDAYGPMFRDAADLDAFTPSMDSATPVTTNTASPQVTPAALSFEDAFDSGFSPSTSPEVLETTTLSSAPAAVSFDDVYVISPRSHLQPTTSHETRPNYSALRPEPSTFRSSRSMLPMTLMSIPTTPTPVYRPAPIIPITPTNGGSGLQKLNESSFSPSAKLEKESWVRVDTLPAVQQPPQSSKLRFVGFGRSKAQKKGKNTPRATSTPMPGAHIISPVNADLTGGIDIEDVLKLVGMGFTRDQAYAALDEHGHYISRALNGLLGGGTTPMPGVRAPSPINADPTGVIDTEDVLKLAGMGFTRD
ncbi:hypothetical protein FRB93_003656 [Tulasnella sp. JGI-2019a]|nr:hypothetical protein FRB93_003656 [Tulasnella sp. JGI-2019a]